MSRFITLQDVASSPSTTIQLMIDEDEEGPRWREFRAPPIPPRLSQGALTWSHQDPLVDFIWSQDDWSHGGFQPYYRPNSRRYATSSGVDLRWEGVAAAGPARSDSHYDGTLSVNDTDGWLDYLIRNPGIENTSAPWVVGTGVTLALDSSPVYNALSNRSAKLTTDGSRSSGNTLFSQIFSEATLSPVAVWQSKTITVGVVLLRSQGSESGIRLRVSDGAGANTDSTAVTASSFTYVSVTHTVDASATSVTVSLISSANETTAHIYNADSFIISPTGGVTCEGYTELNGDLYAVFGRVVVRWDETNNVWRAVYIHASAVATDITTFDGNVYVAFGTGSSYIYGSATTWTASTRTTPDDRAIFWTVARNASGAHAIWKSETVNSIANTTAGTNGAAAWTAPIAVGNSDRNITKLYSAFDTVIVGKEDGLWKYQRWDPDNTSGDNLFYNATSSWGSLVDAANFARGEWWWGWLYLSTANQGFVRWKPGDFTDLSSLFFAPRAVDLGGAVRAVGSDPAQLWVVVDAVTADATITKQTKLVAIIDDGVSLRPHPIADMNIGVPEFIAAFSSHLYILGQHYNADLADYTVATTRHIMPSLSRAPFADASTGILHTQGLFRTSIWHGEMPDTSKAFLALTMWVEDITGSRNIRVTYGIDGAPATTTTLGTISGTARVQTLYFHSVTNPETNAVGRAIQLEFRPDVVSDISAKMYSFALHSTLRTRKVQTWEVFVRVQSEGMLESGYHQPVDTATTLADLNTLEDQDYPIIFRADLDGDETYVNVTAYLRDRERVSVEKGYEVHRLLLQESFTSASSNQL